MKLPRAPLRQYNVGVPLERIALEILGPLSKSERGNKYLLVIGDYFSKWTDAYPIRKLGARTVARVLVDRFISIFGVLCNYILTKVLTSNLSFSKKCVRYLVLLRQGKLL